MTTPLWQGSGRYPYEKWSRSGYLIDRPTVDSDWVLHFDGKELGRFHMLKTAMAFADAQGDAS